jgi:molecular chaperone GrpE
MDNKKQKNKKNSVEEPKKKESKKNFKAEDWEYKYKRALADYQNLLKRTEREKEEFTKFANERLLLEILPIYDNLKMAIKHSDEKNHDQWLAGVKYVVKQFKDILISLGVEEIKVVGEKFDHNLMEAVDGRGEKVKKEVKPGYKLHGKVIVPAKVILE